MSKMLTGSMWMIALRWSIRGVGLISIFVLARLLTPEDFGLVAMGTLVVGLLAIFSELGTLVLLIRMKDPKREHYDTAWTIMLIQSLALGLILYSAAPYAALYFEDPRVVEVIRWLSLSSVILGFKNVGVINFRKDLWFGKDFKYEFLIKFSGFFITLSLAFYLKSYWALVFGGIGTQLMGVIWSYVMHPYRPRLSLVAWREFLSFSMWITPTNIAYFLNQKLDTLVVGYIGSASQLGVYNVASEISSMATSEIVQPINRALYPNYAKLKEKPRELLEAYLNVLKFVAIICCSFGVGLALVAEDFVFTVLGDQWGEAVPLMRWLAIFCAIAGLCQILGGHIFVVMGREKLMFFLTSLRLVLFSSGVVLSAWYWGDTELIAMAALVTTACYAVVLSFSLQRVIAVTPSQIAATLLRPLISAGAMVFVLLSVDLAPTDNHVVSLAADVILGGTIYLSSLFMLWFIAGRPAGPEKVAAELLMSRLGRQQPIATKPD
ncbi:MAG: lipopolysaccharide biosynthesis protein [Rhodospirillaceae bacterium]|nr:lipopolysaccharide biosynthesis protein [Rhodospirillaceae bacterium]MBT5459928.1 lipopolysaccharide biosynthesis protein [Rhodospirillaceae bacterium]